MKGIKRVLVSSGDVVAFVIVILALGGYIVFGVLLAKENKETNDLIDNAKKLERKLNNEPIPNKLKLYNPSEKWGVEKPKDWTDECNYVIYRPSLRKTRIIHNRGPKKLNLPVLAEIQPEFGRVTIKWKYEKDAEHPAEVKEFRVERKKKGESDFKSITAIKPAKPEDKEFSFEDTTDILPKTGYLYRITAVSAEDNWYDEKSNERAVTTPGIFDISWGSIKGNKYYLKIKKYIEGNWYEQEFLIENKEGFPVGEKDREIWLKSGKTVKEDFDTGYTVVRINENAEKVDIQIIHDPKFDSKGYTHCIKNEIRTVSRATLVELRDKDGNNLSIWSKPPTKTEQPCKYCTQKKPEEKKPEEKKPGEKKPEPSPRKLE